MAKVKRFLNILLIALPLSLTAQDAREVVPGNDGGWATPHVVQAGETLFSLAGSFGAAVSEIKSANPSVNLETLSIGTELNIPLNKNRITTQQPKGTHWVLKRSVKSGDTFFSIARRSGISTGQLQDLTGLSPDQLQPGATLKVGYFVTGGSVALAAKSATESNRSPSDRAKKPSRFDREEKDRLKSSETLAEFREDSETALNFGKQRGVAVWNQDWKSTAGFYVLHRSAPINSIIEIENPMFGRKAFGKVSGRIPSSLYSPDVILIVSDGLAQHLGVIDQRFFVKVQYLQSDEDE
jgi:LysM repeat protein